MTANMTRKISTKEGDYVRFLGAKRSDGRKIPGWKMVIARQARAIILMICQI